MGFTIKKNGGKRRKQLGFGQKAASWLGDLTRRSRPFRRTWGGRGFPSGSVSTRVKRLFSLSSETNCQAVKRLFSMVPRR